MGGPTQRSEFKQILRNSDGRHERLPELKDTLQGNLPKNTHTYYIQAYSYLFSVSDTSKLFIVVNKLKGPPGEMFVWMERITPH